MTRGGPQDVRGAIMHEKKTAGSARYAR